MLDAHTWKYPQVIVIGGSAGSFRVVTEILSHLEGEAFPPVILCLHRLKSVRSGFSEALNYTSRIEVIEPEDKDSIKPGKVYLAPANYHLTIELGKTFSLSTEPMIHNSRPSIDLMFQTAAYVYRHRCLGVLLSGANRDGVTGLEYIKQKGGQTIAQDPDEAEIRTMPEGAIQRGVVDAVLTVKKIIQVLNALKENSLV